MNLLNFFNVAPFFPDKWVLLLEQFTNYAPNKSRGIKIIINMILILLVSKQNVIKKNCNLSYENIHKHKTRNQKLLKI